MRENRRVKHDGPRSRRLDTNGELPMTRPTIDPAAVARWLRAERAGNGVAAETELRRLFVALGSPSPSAGFASRVVVAAVPRAVAWGLERIALVLLLLSGAALWSVPIWAEALWPRRPSIDWVAVLGGLGAAIGDWIVEVASLWDLMAEVGRLATITATDPVVLSILAACGLLAAASSRLLYDLLAERSPDYARS